MPITMCAADKETQRRTLHTLAAVRVVVGIVVILCSACRSAGAATQPMLLLREPSVQGPYCATYRGLEHHFQPSDVDANTLVSPRWSPERAFESVLPSWNIDCPADRSFAVEIQVAGAGGPSRWLRIGSSGSAPRRVAKSGEFPGGRVAVDVLESARPLHWVRLRIRFDPAGSPAAIAAFSLAFTYAGFPGTVSTPTLATRRLAGKIAARSQHLEAPGISGRICSPTSIAMVLETRGRNYPTAVVAERLYDCEHDIYGNWNRAIQGAYELGTPGYLARFDGWDAAARLLDAGALLVISIKAAPGQLSGAPYESTAGHLLLLTGLSADGRVHVHDPAASSLSTVPRDYAASELAPAWFGHGGVAYVFP